MLSRRAALAMLGAGLATRIPTGAKAAPVGTFADAGLFVFVPSAETSTVTVVDADALGVVGSLSLELVPKQALVSRTEAMLIATDSAGPNIVVLELGTGGVARVKLTHVADRLVLGANGWLLAAADTASGAITLYDLRRRRALGHIDHGHPLHDLMFVAEDGYLFVAAAGASNLAVYDVNTGAALRSVGPVGADPAWLARTPGGRHVLTQTAGEEPPRVIDVSSRELVGALGRRPARNGVVPSGTGALLFVPDALAGKLDIFRGGQIAATLDAAPGLGAIYTAWLDSVAFAAHAPGRQLLVYDLDRLRPGGKLDLPGVPGQGGVTSDSRTLFVPTSGPPGLAVIDGRTRQITATLAMPSTPLAALVPGGWGLCH